MSPTKSAAPARSVTRSKAAPPRANVSKAEASYALLRERILDGTYGPGYRLVLDQLARETGVSTIPLREALRRLQSDGFVQVVRNVGARVAEFDSSRVEHTLHVLARLEGYATAVAAPDTTTEAEVRSSFPLTMSSLMLELEDRVTWATTAPARPPPLRTTFWTPVAAVCRV